MIQVLFAAAAGILTIGAPCILPLLPVLLGTSIGQQSRTRPLYIVAGFVIVFAVLGVLLSFLTTHLGVNPTVLRNVAIGLLFIFGLLLIWPKPFELLTVYMSSLTNKAGDIGNSKKGNWGGFILGMTLGIIWTPCAGPILASILALIAIQKDLGHAAVLLAAYAIGAGVPMLIIAYGSQWITTKIRSINKYTVRLQQIFGVLILLLAVAMFKNYDVAIENQLTAFFPQNSLENKLVAQNNSNNTNMATSKYGAAPNFSGISNWLNSQPLSIGDLKGKVVLVDFWTFSCINCIRTLPYLSKWYDTYKDKGLVVVGVHTPEFAFEKDTGNVADAVRRFKINYPVAQDNDYSTWNAYNNQYWPGEYLIDQNGNIVYEHFGEGEYDQTENAIRRLLEINTPVSADNGQNLSQVHSPEMYFEPARLQNLTPGQQPSASPQTYTLTQNLALNNFALSGTWQFSNDHAELTKPNGSIRLKFSSGKVYIVASADHPITIHITVDGKPQPDIIVQKSELYTLFDSGDYTEHTIDILIPDAGFRAFTFTFG